MTNYLRPEARPLSWENLNKAQREALERIVRLMHDSLPARSRPPEQGSGVRRSVDEWLSTDRSSRTIFLDGGRGSGKTTILLSLMHACSSYGAGAIEEAPDRLQQGLRAIRNQVVWLQPIDMEPAPENFHFLGAILARIEQVIGHVGLENNGSGTDGPAGLLDPSPNYYSALTDLRRLQTKVSLAWDSNIETRGPNVDPDTFAQEVMRTEHSRLSVNREVERVLDRLADTVMRASEIREPLFVLPIDDFDLNPPACLPMLRMLRMISVPRLFTFLLGDLRVAQVVLNLKLSGDIASAAERANAMEQISVKPAEVARIAGGVADNALRKLAPPSQCIRLSHYDLAGGLFFRPISAREHDPQLHELLAKIPMAFAEVEMTGVGTQEVLRDYSLTSYLNFLVAPALFARGFELPAPLDPQTPPHSVYQGIELLTSSPRRLADLWLALNNIVTKYGATTKEANGSGDTPSAGQMQSRLLDYFGQEARRLLKSEPALDPSAREIVPSPNKNGGLEIGDWDIAKLPVRLASITSRYANVDTTPTGQHVYEASAALFHARDWQLHVTESNPKKLATSRVLQPETTALYVLVYDLLALLPNPLQPRPPRLENLLADNTSWAATEWSLGGAHLVPLWWPIPPLATVWGFDQFTAAWNKHFSSTSTGGIESSVFAWLSLGSSVLIGKEPLECESGMPGKRDWQKLSGLLQQCVDLTPRARDWAIKAVALLMPEFALPQRAVKGLGETEAIKGFIGRYRHLIRRVRIANLELLWESGFEDLVEGLRTAPEGFDGRLTIAQSFFKTSTDSLWTANRDPSEAADAKSAGNKRRKGRTPSTAS
jgi:hypothetical protein